AVAYMKEKDLLGCFELLHFHLGSQISAIRSVKNALREAGRIYVELAKGGAQLKYLDVGGGLGVDYDGSQTNFASSINYTMQEDANEIVYGLMEVCDAEKIPPPTDVTEWGRGGGAPPAVLVVNMLGASEFNFGRLREEPPDEEAPAVLRNL